MTLCKEGGYFFVLETHTPLRRWRSLSRETRALFSREREICAKRCAFNQTEGWPTPLRIPTASEGRCIKTQFGNRNRARGVFSLSLSRGTARAGRFQTRALWTATRPLRSRTRPSFPLSERQEPFLFFLQDSVFFFSRGHTALVSQCECAPLWRESARGPRQGGARRSLLCATCGDRPVVPARARAVVPPHSAALRLRSL